MTAELDHILGPNGTLARSIPHYEDRPGQRQMAAAVYRSLIEHRALLVEAGTGTGKTLAYLIPALLSGRRVVVSTGTRNLQDQIVNHDLPLLRELLGAPFSAVALKGVGNYLCQRKLADLQARAELPEELDQDTFAEVTSWARDTDTGDRSEVAELAENAPIWRFLTQSPETRLGPKCPHYERCFVTRARRRAEEAELVLVNHHLFFADLSLRVNHPGARVLPEYDAVIFDEAHQLEDVITGYFGVRFSTMDVSKLCQDARFALLGGDLFARAAIAGGRLSARVIAVVERCAASFFELVGRYLGSLRATGRERGEDRIELSDALIGDGEREDAWFQLDNALDELAAQARSVARGRIRERELDEHRPHGARSGPSDRAPADSDEPGDSGGRARGAELAFAVARRAELMREALAALAERTATSFVYWGQVRGTGVALHGAPIDIGTYLREHLLANVPAAVFTSATLTTGRSFEYVRERLGLDLELADELLIDSPFDYARQAFLYIPRDLPDPREPGWIADACTRMAELCRLTQGRAFLLFTSHRALRAAAERLAEATDFQLLVQGRAPRNQLLAEFRRTPGSLLLGTGSFWEGVDVPGEALSLVVIDKLPFAPPSDPLMAARMRRYESAERDPFTELQVPRAALTLEQGFGRLIRRSDDRGIVAVLDHRLLSRQYGQAFLATLPAGLPRTSSFERVRRFWVAGDLTPTEPDARCES